METNQQKERITLAGELTLTHTPGQPTKAEGGAIKGFEILAITAGEGNGWEFAEDVLKKSLKKWDGAECFIDHDLFHHSVKDLAGVCQNPRWDDERKGIKMQLRPIGPSAHVLLKMGTEMLGIDYLPAGPGFANKNRTGAMTAEETEMTEEKILPKVGFSADLVFKAEGRNVSEIVEVYSVDLVINPARGGEYLRALNSKEKKEMTEKETSQGIETPTTQTKGNSENSTAAQLEADRQAVRLMLDEQAKQAALQEEAEKARQVRAEMCTYLLDSALANAKLPRPVSDRIRKQFAGNVFEVSDLQAAIEDARNMVSEMTGAITVLGPAGNISGMYNSTDQIEAAVHDLLGARRPDNLAQVKPHRLSGIRELYTMLTGDYDFMGGYHPERAQLATSANLPAVLKNALNKLIVMQWEELGRSGYRWWEPVVQVVHFNSLQPVTGVLVGEVALLPSVSEGAAYTELDLKDSEEAGTWAKYGGYVGLTLEMFEKDETLRLKQYPKKLASAALRRISNLVGACFTSSSGTGPTMADSYHVFDNSHHGNLGTAGLAGSSFDLASKAIYNQNLLMPTSGSANPARMALEAKYLIVPRDLKLTAMRILYPSFEREANIFSENMQRGQMGDVIVCPEFTDANDWAAVADPALAPGIIIAERFGLMPEIFIADNELQGALFTNDEVRMKVRHWLSVFVADYRPMYKSNVA